MAGGFGAAMFAAAGAMQGVGNQIVEDAKAKREEKLKQLEREFQLKRDDIRYARDVELKKMDQTFQGGENEKSRTFQGGENAANRNQQSSENQKARDAQRDLEDAREKARAAEGDKDRALKGEYATGPDGKTVILQGGQAKPVTGPDGQPIGSVTRAGGADSEAQRRLRFKDGLDAGKPEFSGEPHNWSKSVAMWRYYGIQPTDSKIVELVKDDLTAQAGKKGLKGDANVKWVNDEMMRLGVGVNSSTENLRAPGPTAPTRLPSGGGGFSSALPPGPGGSSDAMRGAPGATMATPSASQSEVNARVSGAFSAFPKGDSQAGKGAPPVEYPDAQWSDAAGGWVVRRDGKWFRVKG